MAMAIERTILSPLFPGSRTPEEFRAAVRAVLTQERSARKTAGKKTTEKKPTAKKTAAKKSVTKKTRGK
jgi:topoisomerase IA-like protein